MTTPEEFARTEHAPITRAEAPVSGISLPAHLGVGTDLVDPLDYVVIIQVMFDVSSGRKVSPILVWQRLQERGIRSTKHRSELVGKNAVYDAFGRIIEAGYMQRYAMPNEKHPGRKGPIAYRVYDNPAWNPDWQARHVGSDPLQADADGSTTPQVGMLPQYRDDLKPEESRGGKAAGRNASPVPGSPVPGSGNQGRGGSTIPAGRNASPVPGSPPHPPEEEVGTTSPSPHKHATTSRRDKQATPDVDPAAAAAAAQFLMRLPGDWSAGLQRAENLAPWLVTNAALTGWDLDVALRMYLTRPETGKRPIENYGAVLAYRIKNMQPREAVLEAAAAEEEPEQQPEATPGLPAWCGECDSEGYRWFVPEEGAAKQCPTCHPAAIARARSGA